MNREREQLPNKSRASPKMRESESAVNCLHLFHMQGTRKSCVSVFLQQRGMGSGGNKSVVGSTKW